MEYQDLVRVKHREKNKGGYPPFVVRNSRNNLESSGKCGGYSSFFYIRKFENLEENLLILANSCKISKN